MPKYIIENGMRIEIPDGEGLNYVRQIAPEQQREDMICYEDQDGNLVPAESEEGIPDGARIVRVPEVVKGDADRLSIEIQLLSDHIHGRGRSIESGKKTIDGVTYSAVVIKNFPLNRSKYSIWKTDILFMLPPQYPRVPALGCYMKFPPAIVSEKDHHATLRAHYGAPELQNQGWYWYCVGLGRNFAVHGYEDNEIRRIWRPGSRPQNGHNLVTLYGIADRGINTP